MSALDSSTGDALEPIHTPEPKSSDVNDTNVASNVPSESAFIKEIQRQVTAWLLRDRSCVAI